MGHDLGHTPFGHAGEEVLNDLLPGGFKHNVQSLRVVEKLEYDGKGLNLTWEVRDGIVNHTSSGHLATVEGKVVSLADRIAYINHDIDDAMRAGVLTEEDLLSFFRAAKRAILPGGALIFDVSTPEKLSGALGNQTLYSDDERISYIWRNHFDEKSACVRMTLSVFVRRPDGKTLVDLRAANARRLVQLGVPAEQIDVSEECTFCSHDKYWSHRYTRGQRGGQCACIVL